MANPSSVLAPYLIFSDLNGDPLSNGYLYIGVANQNPETNPVAVYWDSALSIPVAQPIRTIGGAPSRNGAPSSIYVSVADYSTTVKDSSSRLVSYSPSVSLRLPITAIPITSVPITPSVFESLRRSYAEAGLNLVDGSFEEGGTLTSASDVLLHKASGKAYSGPVGGVAAGTDPTAVGSGYVPRTDITLRGELSNMDGANLVGSATYATLRAYTGTATSIYVDGRSNVFDGGFGYFDLDATDTVSADNGGTIIVDANGGRWKRRLAGEINLLWFATGDGVTSDYAALVAAHNALPSNGGRIYAPGGRSYLIDGNFVATKPYFQLRGDGDAVISGDVGCTTFIKAPSVSGALFEIRGIGSTLEMFAIKGAAGNTGDGIQILAGRCSIKRVSSGGCGQDGIRIGHDLAGYNCNLWVIEDVKAKGNGRYGINLDDKPVASPGLADANGGMLRHCDLQNNALHGLNIGNSQLNTIIGVVSQTNSGRGVYFSPLALYNTYIGGDSESSGGDEIYLDAGSKGNVLLGGVVYGSVTNLGDNTVLGIGGSPNYGGLRLNNENSSVSTVLDWYEEVDWSSSAAITFTTPGDVAVTYSLKKCTAQRIGNEVVAKFTINTSSFTHSTASGSLQVTGLPWKAVAVEYSAGPLQYQGITSATKTCITSRVNPNASVVRFIGCGSGVGIGEITAGEALSGGTLMLTGEIRYRCAL